MSANTSKLKSALHTVTFEWTIDTFNHYEKIGNNLTSPAFFASTNDQIVWKLLLKANGNNIAKNTISLYLYLSISSLITNVYATFEVFVLNSEKEKTSFKSAEIRKFHIKSKNYKADTCSWGWKDFLTKDEYFRTNVLCSDQLRIHIKVVFSEVLDVLIESCNKLTLKSNDHECNLPENLASLLNSRAFSDVVLSANGKYFPAHKVLLAARSKVFAAMFQHDMNESRLNRVNIENMSDEVVEEMLRFIYTGRCEKLDDLAEELLAAADKYDLDRLKLICSKKLYGGLSAKNASHILILADMYNANELKNDVIEFIVSRACDVLTSAGWRNVQSKPQLLDEVCQALARRLTSAIMENDH